ncbi:MAG: class I adenylate-forming enzyme family protein [Pseudonocardiaceae bacterium]
MTLHHSDLAPDGPVTTETWLGAPTLSYPRRPSSVARVLDRAVARWPHAPAARDAAGEVSHAALANRVAATVTALHRAGLRRGDTVAVAAANSVDHLALVLACARGGFVVSGFNLRLAPARWNELLAITGARLALADEARIDVLRSCAGEIPVLPLRDVTAAGAATWAALDVGWPAETAHFQVVHTSGSTGRSKASKVVHRCSVHAGMSYQRVLQLAPGERTAVSFHLGYISALHAHVLPAMLAGACSVLLDPASPRSYVPSLAEHGVSWAYAVPAWWQAVLPSLSAAGLPALRLLGAGGATFGASLERALRERLPDTELLNIYGLSETHSPATILRNSEFAARPGSVGRPLPCMEVAVRSADGADLPPGEAGEVWLRGSLVTTGYDGMPAETAEAIVDGWFRTGDVGRVDADGYLWVLDRVKDMINRGGQKVYSADVEEVLRAHPAIADAAVVAAPDPRTGETVAAFLVLAPGAQVSPPDVRRHVREHLADWAAPSVVEVVDALPRNPTGKTDKPALRSRLT